MTTVPVTMRKAPLKKVDLLIVLGIIVIWGTNFVAMKIGLRDVTPFQLGAARYVFAILPLILFIAPPKLHWKWILLYGLFQGVGQFGLLFLALHVGMTAALASVLLQTQIFFTALFSFFFLSEKPGPPLIIGMLFAAGGLGCFIFNYLAPQIDSTGETTFLGFALCLGSAAMWAVSNIVVRLAQKESSSFNVLSFLVWSSAVPIIPFVMLSLWIDPSYSGSHWNNVPWQGWLSIAYLGWVATILAYSLWTMLLKRYGANTIAPFSLGVPVVGLASGMLFLGEHVTILQWIGIALTVLALACVVLGGRMPKRQEK